MSILPSKPVTRILIGTLCVAMLSGGCAVKSPVSSAPTTTTQTTSEATSTTTTTTLKPTTTRTYIKPTRANGKVLINAPLLNQFPEYPSGCESVAAVMALKHAGENTSVYNFIDKHLPCSQNMFWKDGKYYAPSPYEYFLGDPRSQNSYGCMSSVIKAALIHYFGSDDRVIDTTGRALSNLCKTYIDNGIPAIVWASIGMIPLTDGPSWILPDGTTYVWPDNEHCLLLVGYDDGKYYFNDPYRGKVIGYARSVVEQRYEQLGMQSLVII